MSDRYTRKDVEEALQRFCRIAGVPYAEDYYQTVGGLYVDNHNGYKICMGDGVGGREPFGAVRRPAKEMVQTLEFAGLAIDIAMRARDGEPDKHFNPTLAKGTAGTVV